MLRVTLLPQAFYGSSIASKQRFTLTATASAILIFQLFATPVSFSSPVSTSSSILSYLLSFLWLIPYAIFYIGPYPWLIITYIMFCITNPPDLITPTTAISKAKKRDNRIKLGLTAEACNNRVVWCFENLFPTIFIAINEWNVWTALNSPLRGLLPFDPNAAWLSGTGSDALCWILTLLWTPVLALLGLSGFVYPFMLWIYALDDALDGISEKNWEGIGMEGEKLIDMKEVK
ncbi:hypothetical protein N431DRAFT_465986 [Stipitochalara longipes BDJ]|nr:hypothetical protein N431DRAFT_465986 [Stipitochalara longipes BDJ]